jgi:hypothetical protein
MELKNNIEALAFGLYLAVNAPSEDQLAAVENTCQQLMDCMTEDEIRQAYEDAEAILAAEAA